MARRLVSIQLAGTAVILLTVTPGLRAQGIDQSFNPTAIGSAGTGVYAVVTQPDGRIVIGGNFDTVNGTPRTSLARLNSNGSLDGSFTTVVTTGGGNLIRALALQADGKILVGGNFTALSSTPRNRLARLLTDGSLEPSFAPNFNGPVDSVVIQPDGKILVGGSFSTVDGQSRVELARLNADGSLDMAFNPGLVVTIISGGGVLVRTALDSSGRIIVAGGFSKVQGVNRNGLARLMSDGTLDATFDPNPDHPVQAIAVRPDGRILLGGTFTVIDGQLRSYLAQLDANGDLDPTFDPNLNFYVYALALQSDGRLVVGGQFITIDNQPVYIAGRLLVDGLVDTNFGPFPQALNSSAQAVALQADGKVLIGGGFGPFTGLPNRNLLRVNQFAAPETAPSFTTHPANQTLSPGQNAVFSAAAAGVPSPLICWQSSTDGGTTWTNLPAAACSVGLATLNVAAGPGLFTGLKFRAVATNPVGTATSNAATVTVVTPPTMSLDRSSLRFAATRTVTGFTSQTLGQTVRLTQQGPGSVGWTATPSHPWISVSPSSGTGSATLTVTVAFSTTLPSSGTSNGTVALAFTGAANTSAGPITVALTTIPNGTSTAPNGVLDTPADNSIGVTGSIAVTGWVIDDVEVLRVRILRDPVAGEGAAQIFIGHAVFVDGSRTDIAAANPTVPRSSRAGWGYLLLTNFLPNEGNGTFKLYAYADDVDGHTALLGTRTITCTNSAATRPFGAIDTPAQGDVISGSAYVNFGWVLSRGPARAHPPNGTVRVVIDGVFGAFPSGWTSRADLTALFPALTYPGVTNALGVSIFDTTTLSNGVHTIAWVVTADNGQADGVGSRYFTVANGSSLISSVASHSSLRIDAPGVSGLKADTTAIAGRRGWDITAPLRTYAADARGRVTVTAEELDRIELHVGANTAGYLRVGDELEPLPIGSHLTPAGVFTWAPGVGFVHAYDFVFAGPAGRRDVRIVLESKRSTRIGPQVAIDVPAVRDPDRQIRLQQPFDIAGWAIDADADAGTGVDTLHVWAYPLDGEAPIFLGATAYGGERPDVGTIFGERFTPSGYSLTVDGLTPRSYDLAVFAWSTVQGGFVPAKVVRVTVNRQ